MNRQQPTQCRTEREITRSIDLRILPYLFLLFLISYMDRTNIGHAKLLNIEASLDITPYEFRLSLSLFFVGYILFEIPSNLMLKRTRPSFWLGLIMIPWGAVVIFMIFCKDGWSLSLCRFLLGVFEAGLFPGIVHYLGTWYTRREIGLRLAYVICALYFSGGLGGLVGVGLSYLGGAGWLGLLSWQWLFLIEGIPTVVLGVATWFVLPDNPQKVGWLTPEEKIIVKDKLEASFVGSDGADDHHIDPAHIKKALFNYRTWLHMVIYFGFASPVFCMSLMLPTILNQMGLTTTNAMLLTIPPYLLAMVTALVISNRSDKKIERSYHLLACLLLTMVGFVLLVVTHNLVVNYLAIVLILISLSPCAPINLAWSNNNLQRGGPGGSTQSAVSSALIVMACNLGGVVAGQLYWEEDGPYFLHSHLINLGLLALSWLAGLALRMALTRENQILDRQLMQVDLSDSSDISSPGNCVELTLVDDKHDKKSDNCHSTQFRFIT